MEKANLTMMFLFLATILEQNMNNFLKHIMETNVLWSLIKNVAQNIQRRLIFEGTTIHNSHNGC
jgi:hypothetical protein